MSWTTGKWKSAKYNWYFAPSVQKEVTLASYRGWKVDLFWKFQAKKIVGRPRRTIHIDARPSRFDRKTMLCVRLDQRGVVYYELLKPGETVNTKRYQQRLSDLNRFLLVKRPKYSTCVWTCRFSRLFRTNQTKSETCHKKDHAGK